MKRSREEANGQQPPPVSDTDTAASSEPDVCFPRVKKLMEKYNPTPRKNPSKANTASQCNSARTIPSSSSARVLRNGRGGNGPNNENGNGQQNVALDPVEVYCRVRPLPQTVEVSCIRIIDERSLELIQPLDPQKWQTERHLTYSFKHVFNEMTPQRDVFNEMAQPLAKEVLCGKNALLFAYGVTGAGKTYTMSGTKEEPGIMPRCLDLIFNSIENNRAMKHVFKSDKMNGFEVQSRAEAMLERQREQMAASAKTPSSTRKGYPQTPIRTPFVPTMTPFPKCNVGSIPLENDRNVYSVFITYVEIYNNFVYDLLDENPIDFSNKKTFQTKILREDAYKNVYVNGVVEHEVDSSQEAYEIYLKGQKRKRMAQTNLNAESSRSHSIFNIRLVQAPLDSEEEVTCDKSNVTVSQLSLCDLAGSERYGRSQATGERLKEAGNINSSLMTLRKCMDMLRENQKTNTNKIVPYRDSKLTHFLKSYFETGAHSDCTLGARVKVMLCVNPQAADYDENYHVMMFAELTQDIVVQRPTTVPVIEQKKAETPTTGRKLRNNNDGKRRGVINLDKVMKQQNGQQSAPSTSSGTSEEELRKIFPITTNPNVIFSLVPNMLPLFKNTKSDDANYYVNLQKSLEDRIRAKTELFSLIQTKREYIRTQLVTSDRDLDSLRNENSNLKFHLSSLTESKEATETVLRKIQDEKTELETLNEEKELELLDLRQELEDCKMQLMQREMKHLKDQEKLKSDLDVCRELDDIKRQRQMQKEQDKLKAKYVNKDKTLDAVRQLVTGFDDEGRKTTRARQSRTRHESFLTTTSSESDLPSVVSPTRLSRSRSRMISAPHLLDANMQTRSTNSHLTPGLRSESFRRAQATFSEGSSKTSKWVHHTAGQATSTSSTLFQPKMGKKKSVRQLNYKDITKANAQKYGLETENKNDDGVVESLLYKGDIIQTVDGGAQVKYYEVEKLTTASPLDIDTQKVQIGVSNSHKRRSSTHILFSENQNLQQDQTLEPVESNDYAANLAELRERCKEGYGHYNQSEGTPEIEVKRKRSRQK